jgi:Flp pilus assembly protein TadB
MRRSRADQPALITTAPESGDEEYDRRRKRYAIMMALRALFVLGAAVSYHTSVALALGFAIGGVVLPWCAVLLANDRPPKKRERHVTHAVQPVERALPPGSDDRTVDG